MAVPEVELPLTQSLCSHLVTQSLSQTLQCHIALQEAVAIPESELPLVLPDTDNFQPRGTPESPLSVIEDWMTTVDPASGRPARRESSTMPQVGSLGPLAPLLRARCHWGCVCVNEDWEINGDWERTAANGKHDARAPCLRVPMLLDTPAPATCCNTRLPLQYEGCWLAATPLLQSRTLLKSRTATNCLGGVRRSALPCPDAESPNLPCIKSPSCLHSGRAAAGTTCGTSTPGTAARWWTRKQRSTGCRWTCTWAAPSTPCCTCCMPASGTRSGST